MIIENQRTTPLVISCVDGDVTIQPGEVWRLKMGLKEPRLTFKDGTTVIGRKGDFLVTSFKAARR